MEKRSERLSATGDISEAETAEGAKSDALATVKGGAVDEVAPKKQSVGCRRMQQVRKPSL